MLYSHFTEKLIGLQGVLIKNVENNENFISISIEMRECEVFSVNFNSMVE